MKRTYEIPRAWGLWGLPFDRDIAAGVLGDATAEFYMRFAMLHVYMDPCFAWNEL